LVALAAPAVQAAAPDDSARIWAQVAGTAQVADPQPTGDLAALNPTLAAIRLGGSTAIDVPWHAIDWPPAVPITPIAGAEATDDNQSELSGPTLAAPVLTGPVLAEPRLAMRDQPGKSPDFTPVWRSPHSDDLINAFDQASQKASEATAKPADSPPAAQQPAAPSATPPATQPAANPDDQPATEPQPTPAAPAVDRLQPVETPPQLTKPNASDSSDSDKSAASKPATSTPRSASPSTQSSPSITPEASDASERDESSDAPSRPSVIEKKRQLPPLTREQINLRNKMRTVLAHYYKRPLNSGSHDSWEIMHGMLAYGLDSKVRQGSERGEPITAIGWLCYNNTSKQTQLLEVTAAGELRAKYGVGVQGHMGQFLAMLAQCNVTRTYPIRVDGREFTINDLIASEQKTCYADSELTFKLIGLMHYLPSDSTWLNDRGESWSIDRLIQEELKQPIRGAACGGTHRLAGLSLAARRRLERGEPLDGMFLQAAKFTAQHEALCFRLQNTDGSFSTEWFKGPGAENDNDRRIRTTGHTLEWMLYQIDDEQLDYWRTVRAVNYLTNLLYSNANQQWDTGALCHALHALVLYDQRKFQPYDGDVPSLAARTPIPAASKSPTKDGYGPGYKDKGERDSGFRLFGGRR
jgi:hypothetical protein